MVILCLDLSFSLRLFVYVSLSLSIMPSLAIEMLGPSVTHSYCLWFSLIVCVLFCTPTCAVGFGED